MPQSASFRSLVNFEFRNGTKTKPFLLLFPRALMQLASASSDLQMLTVRDGSMRGLKERKHKLPEMHLKQGNYSRMPVRVDQNCPFFVAFHQRNGGRKPHLHAPFCEIVVRIQFTTCQLVPPWLSHIKGMPVTACFDTVAKCSTSSFVGDLEGDENLVKSSTP